MKLKAALVTLVTIVHAHDTVTVTETKTVAACAESCCSTVTVNICTSIPGTASLSFTKTTTAHTAAPTETCTNPYGCEYPVPSPSESTEKTALPAGTSTCYWGYGCESTTRVTRQLTQTDTVAASKSRSTSSVYVTSSAESTYPTPGYPSSSEEYPYPSPSESSMQAETTEYGTAPTYTPPYSTAESSVHPVSHSSKKFEEHQPITAHVPCGPSSNYHPTYSMPNGTSTNGPWSSGTAPGTTVQTAKPTGFSSRSVTTYATPTESSSDEYPYPEPTYSSPEETYHNPTSAESTVEAASYTTPTTSTEDEYYPPPPTETTSADEGYYPPPSSDYGGGKWPTSTIPISAESTVDAVQRSSTSVEGAYYPPPRQWCRAAGKLRRLARSTIPLRQ